MSDKRIINITANNNAISRETKRILKKKLEENGFLVSQELSDKTELIICIGGDGALLRTLNLYKFPDVPIIGINTGHLGFFQEISPDELDDFIIRYNKGNYQIQKLKTVEVDIEAKKELTKLMGLNEIIIKAGKSRTIHLNLSLDNNFVERFSGDGILVATPAGSTAYNYALGGSIVDPRLGLLQITPISPMNTTAYRSFTSSVIVPPETSINIYPEYTFENSILVVVDGIEYNFEEISAITIFFAEKTVNLLRFESYDFWNKVKTKFLL